MADSESTNRTDETNHLQPVEKLPGDGELADTYVPLSRLHENDYNPRRGFDDARMADFAERIERDGLLQSLLVRPLENTNEKEVVAGTRRLRALRRIHDADAEVLIPVRVRDLDDQEARRLALEENLARESLTPLEEAYGFAEAIIVHYAEDNEPQRFVEYLQDAKGEHVPIRVPSHNDSEVKELAKRVTPGDRTISNRLLLLVLPAAVQTRIEQENFPLRVAERIASGLQKIPDPELRREHMSELADDPAYTDPLDLDGLQQRVESILDAYERQHTQNSSAESGDRLETLEQHVQQRDRELRQKIHGAISWYNNREVTNGELSDDIDQLLATAETAIDAFQQQIDELDGRYLDEIEDDLEARQRDRDRLAENLAIVRSEGHGRCPFCRATVRADDLEDRVEYVEDELEAIKQDRQEIESERDQFRERRQDLRMVLREHEEAVSQLEAERERQRRESETAEDTAEGPTG